MSAFSYQLDHLLPPTLGLIVLQSDETIEQDFRKVLPSEVHLHVSRVPSAPEVTRETLQAMQDHLSTSAGLLPQTLNFDAIGYGCTSGTAQIGAGVIAERVTAGAQTKAVSEPVSALLAACKALGLKRLAILSPYIEDVSRHLRDVLAEGGVQTPIFGSFEEASEQKVVRISAASIRDAALELVAEGGVDGLFLSCTNLRTFDVIADLEERTGLPVLSSNQVLAWHLTGLAGVKLNAPRYGKLMTA